MNVRLEEKRQFDLLQKWWSLRDGRPRAQWDGFSILLAHYMDTANLPPELLDVLADDQPM